MRTCVLTAYKPALNVHDDTLLSASNSCGAQTYCSLQLCILRLLISTLCFFPRLADYWGTAAPMLRKNEIFTGPNPVAFQVDLTADPTKLAGPRVGLAPTGKCTQLGDGTPLTFDTKENAHTFTAGPFTKPTQQVLCFKPTISSVWYEQESPMAVLTVKGTFSNHVGTYNYGISPPRKN